MWRGKVTGIAGRSPDITRIGPDRWEDSDIPHGVVVPIIHMYNLLFATLSTLDERSRYKLGIMMDTFDLVPQ